MLSTSGTTKITALNSKTTATHLTGSTVLQLLVIHDISLIFTTYLYSAMKQKRDAYVKRLNDIYYANLEKV